MIVAVRFDEAPSVLAGVEAGDHPADLPLAVLQDGAQIVIGLRLGLSVVVGPGELKLLNID